MEEILDRKKLGKGRKGPWDKLEKKVKKRKKKVNPRRKQMEQYTHNPAYPGPSLDKECGCLPDCGCKETKEDNMKGWLP